MARRRVRTEDPPHGRRVEEPTHKSAVANYITQGHSNAGCVSKYYGRKKRPVAEQIDIVKEKIASFKKIRKVKTIGELMAGLKTNISVNLPTSLNGGASKYKHAPPPAEQERRPRAYYSCAPRSSTRLKKIRKTPTTQNNQRNEPSKKYSIKQDISQKTSSLKDTTKNCIPLTGDNIPQKCSLVKSISQSKQVSHPSTKTCSPQGVSIEEDQMYKSSSRNTAHTSSPTKNSMSQELPIADSQESQKLPLVERVLPDDKMNPQTTSTNNMPMKPETLRDNSPQKISPLKEFSNTEFLSANDGSSQGPSFTNSDKSPKDQPTELDIIPQESQSNATLKIYCDYMKKVGVQKMEGLTGNYCFRDDVFREWHEGLYRPTYGGDLLQILPYSITD